MTLVLSWLDGWIKPPNFTKEMKCIVLFMGLYVSKTESSTKIFRKKTNFKSHFWVRLIKEKIRRAYEG